MKITKTQEGVVAEYQGRFWGIQYEDGKCCEEGFGEIDKAKISDEEFCKKATDMTWAPRDDMPYNPYYEALKKAVLRKIKVTTIYEIE